VVDSDRFSDPEEAAEAKFLAAFVWEAAKGLDPNQYAVLDLTVRQGLDSAEIADVLGVTKNNAYVMVNRMKKTLEDAIGACALQEQPRRLSGAGRGANQTRLGEMSPEARRADHRHSSKCPVCSDKKKMASPFAIFSAFGMVQPVMGKAGILEGLLRYPYAGATTGAGASSEMSATSSSSVSSSGRRRWRTKNLTPSPSPILRLCSGQASERGVQTTTASGDC
jgi:hypothetical protein